MIRSLMPAAIMLVACSAEAESLTIDDAERAGFQRDQQQIYQMIGAQDGWNGEWAGDTVELYQYKSESAVRTDAFDAAVQEGNVSGWIELCQVKNLVMLSKGETACRRLEQLPKK